MTLKQLILLLILIPTITTKANKGAYQVETSQEKKERMQWYSDARFGMFIHWGAYSVLNGEYQGKQQKDPKGEWIMNHLKIPVNEYRDSIVSLFNPQNFDANKWAKTAYDAGMKYIVITTKHHDGFALFHSQVSHYNIVDATPFKRDIIKELSEACHNYGLKFGIYYSQAQDWYHPGGYLPKNRWDAAQEGEWSDYFNTIVKGQVTELLTNYGDISLLWWDSGRAVQDKDLADKIGKELVALQPDIIVNPRLGGKLKGDFQTHEQVIPAVFKETYNELCLTHNRSWSYKKSDTAWKSPEFILKTLVQMSAQGANFLFNVGPDSNGNFPPETEDALAYIGKWIKTNGESIYGTKKSPFLKLEWGYCTRKTNEKHETLYLHVYDWPSNGILNVKGLKSGVNNAYLLNGRTKLKVTNTPEGVKVLNLPKYPTHEAISVVVMELNGELIVEDQFIKANEGGVFTLNPSDALFTIKPQFDHIPLVVNVNNETYIDNWKNNYPHPRFNNTGNAAHWNISVNHSGKYKVFANVATCNSQNVVSIQGKNKIYFTLPHTGGMDSFKDIEMGTINLDSGNTTITFSGGKTDDKWDDVRIKRIILLPIE